MSQQNEESPFCFAGEAYKVTPFGLRTFWRHTLEGRIPSYKFGRSRLFKKEEVIAAIEKCRLGTTSEALS